MRTEDKKKLFAVYLGGSADGCNIEMHDVVFVVGTTIEETHPLLVKKWFGNQNHVHIDSYVELHTVDGYQIEVSPKPVDNTSKKTLFY